MDTRAKFDDVRRQLLRAFSRRHYPTQATRAIRDISFDDRTRYLETNQRRRIERPLPVNARFFHFGCPLNTLFSQRWDEAHWDPFLEKELPTPPFLACRNHPTIGQLLSHKRRSFDSHPIQPSLQPDNAVPFVSQRFNRPRRRQDLAKSLPPNLLRLKDHSCGNQRCLACPLIKRPRFLASTRNHTTHPVATGLHCLTQGVVYVLTCRRCGKQYVGETGQTMRQRFARHRQKFASAPMSLYSHFRLYHRIDHLDVDIVLVSCCQDPDQRLSEERRWIQQLGTIVPRGLNNPPPSESYT